MRTLVVLLCTAALFGCGEEAKKKVAKPAAVPADGYDAMKDLAARDNAAKEKLGKLRESKGFAPDESSVFIDGDAPLVAERWACRQVLLQEAKRIDLGMPGRSKAEIEALLPPLREESMKARTELAKMDAAAIAKWKIEHGNDPKALDSDPFKSDGDETEAAKRRRESAPR